MSTKSFPTQGLSLLREELKHQFSMASYDDGAFWGPAVRNIAAAWLEAKALHATDLLERPRVRQKIGRIVERLSSWSPPHVDELAMGAIQGAACAAVGNLTDDSETIAAKGHEWIDKLNSTSFSELIGSYQREIAWATLALDRAEVLPDWIADWSVRGSKIIDTASAIVQLSSTLGGASQGAHSLPTIREQYQRMVRLAPGLLSSQRMNWPEFTLATCAYARLLSQEPAELLSSTIEHVFSSSGSALEETAASSEPNETRELASQWKQFGDKRYASGTFPERHYTHADRRRRRIGDFGYRKKTYEDWGPRALVVAREMVMDVAFFDDLMRPALRTLAADFPDVLKSFRKTRNDVHWLRNCPGPFSLRKLLSVLAELVDPIAPKTAWIERSLQSEDSRYRHDIAVLAALVELDEASLAPLWPAIETATAILSDPAAFNADAMIAAFKGGEFEAARGYCIAALRAIPESTEMTTAHALWLAAFGACRLDREDESQTFPWLRRAVGLPEWQPETPRDIHPSLPQAPRKHHLEMTAFEDKRKALTALRQLNGKSMSEVLPLLAQLPVIITDEILDWHHIRIWTECLKKAGVEVRVASGQPAS